ncbi:hypothetical protein MVEN_02531400 [Mycena venus]|uniref:Uncharacterized protein n=1 Tax=Mycena venus TaxID=2733690 RepID=A0A8H6WUT2_9AGAR|nr:hypothetical protein MVEN_02531400 [Mycena venus]
MFSRLNHHHQSGVAACLTAPPTLTAPYDFLKARDTLLAHHRHLESLLDSVLATLTLIHESESTTHIPLPYSPHLLGVFDLISCRISTQTTVLPTSLPLVTTPPAPPAPATPATYAAVADPHCVTPPTADPRRAAPPTAPDPTIAKHPVARHPAAERPPRVIIRFDKEPTHLPPPLRRSPAALYDVIVAALDSLFRALRSFLGEVRIFYRWYEDPAREWDGPVGAAFGCFGQCKGWTGRSSFRLLRPVQCACRGGDSPTAGSAPGQALRGKCNVRQRDGEKEKRKTAQEAWVGGRRKL